MAALLITFLAMPASLATLNPRSEIKPNIVFILADDLGYGDVACQNPGSKIRTPRLDRLASEGLRFTDAHAPSALCTPSRYGILTGQYCWRSRLKAGALNMWDEPLIAPERLTVASMLQRNGYRTACFGKWHLGLAWPFVRTIPPGFDTTVRITDIDWTKRIGGGPVDHGFDYYFGVNVPNDPPYAFIENDRVLGVPTTGYPTVTGQQGHWAGPGVAGWDWSQLLPVITSNTVRWIQRSASASPSQPFFLYLPLVGPHQPVVPNAQFQHTSQAGIYGDYVQELDWAVGEVLDALQAAGVADNTLVMFTSDNGPDEFAYARLQDYGHASMGALRGIKNDIWEGGHRVPLLARWPVKIASGTTSNHPTCLIDFMRTIAEVIGANLPSNAAEDSVSFLTALLGTTPTDSTSRTFILESGSGQFGIRSNNWIYIDSSTGDGHNPEAEPLWFRQRRGYDSNFSLPALLYDLGQDLAQRTNLLTLHPNTVAHLKLKLQQGRPSKTWSGALSGEWSKSANWVPAGLPAGADVVYTNLLGATHYSQTLGANLEINSLVIGSTVRSNLSIALGRLILSNGIDMSAANIDLSIDAALALGQSQIWSVAEQHTLTVQGPIATQGYGLTICGLGNTFFTENISGAGRLTVRSAGLTVLGGNNSFSGGLELSGGGFLEARNDHALGSGTLTIPNNSTLHLVPGIILTNAAMIQGSGGLSGGILSGAIALSEAGSASYNGPITLSGDTGLLANAPASVLNICGQISGEASLTVLPGAGAIVFATNQLYTGGTMIEGRLKLFGGNDRLPAGTAISLANSSSAELDLNDNDQVVSSVSGGGDTGGNIALGRGTLRIQQTEAVTYHGAISGVGNLVKSGPGALTLTGTNSYTGNTAIRGGSLLVNGTLGETVLTVSDATLSGTGLISGPVTIENGGVLLLGNSFRGLTISNELVLNAGSVTQIEIDGVHVRCGHAQGLSKATYAGLLLVSNVAPAIPLTNGQTFRLFAADFGRGNFGRISPSPGPGLVWSFDATTGILRALAPPTLQVASVSTNKLVLYWQGKGFHLQAQTNSFGLDPTGEWFDYPEGNNSPIVLPISPASRNMFLRLVTP